MVGGRVGRVGMALGALAVTLAALGCGGPPPLPQDPQTALGPLVGSWSAIAKGEHIWQGRWRMHVQGGAIVLRQPDGELLLRGLVDAAGPGAISLSADLTCTTNEPTVGRGVYAYELSTDGLRFSPTEEADPCLERLEILTTETWTTAPSAAMPLRVDARADASCDPPPAAPSGGLDGSGSAGGGSAGGGSAGGGSAGGGAAGSGASGSGAPGSGASASADPAGGAAEPRRPLSPVPWTLENRTAGFLVVIDEHDPLTERTLVAQAAPGETVLVDPQIGSIWLVADLEGRCLARVSDAALVSVATGAAPRIERR